MIVLLPPSETKRGGGDGPALTLDSLSSPALRPLRAELVDELVALAADPAASRTALGLSASQDSEIERNAALWTAPTMPALHRYTGVLYDALDVTSLRGASAGRATAWRPSAPGWPPPTRSPLVLPRRYRDIDRLR